MVNIEPAVVREGDFIELEVDVSDEELSACSLLETNPASH
jgi:hypothetical protein